MNSVKSLIKVEQLLPAFDAMTDAVFIDNEEGVCCWCNNTAEHYYQISMDDIIGKSASELEDMGVFSPSVTLLVLKNKTESTIIHENSEGRRLITTGTPILTRDGEVDMVITVSRDITLLTHSEREKYHNKLTIEVMSDDSEPLADIGNGIIARSQEMYNTIALTRRLAYVDSTILLTGESGVGKTMIAKTIHEESNRNDKPFVTVNCGAIPENLIESELFGYVAGAFTGSRSSGKKGLFQAAEGGTILLDEISELPLNLQVKLLQVIQERRITPVGAVDSIPINVRIISATNKDLAELVKEGKFRDDLFYRLNVVPIRIPALRERPEDIVPLIEMNLKKQAELIGEKKTITPEAMSILVNYSWPGNIRELQNIVERLMITTSGNVITEDDIFIFIKRDVEENKSRTTSSLNAVLEQTEKEILMDAAKTFKTTRAIARALQVSQPTIVRKLNKYGINAD